MSNNVLFHREECGDSITITKDDYEKLSNETKWYIIANGFSRIGSSARTGVDDVEAKAEKMFAQLRGVLNDVLPSAGGGNRLSDVEREHRSILAHMLGKLRYKQTEALKLIRDDINAAHRTVAEAQFKAKYGKAPNKEELSAASDTVAAGIEAKARQNVEARSIDFDI